MTERGDDPILPLRTAMIEDGDFDQGQRSTEPETNSGIELGDQLGRLRLETKEREAGMMEREARPLRGTTLPEERGRSSTSSTRSLMRTTERAQQAAQEPSEAEEPCLGEPAGSA